MSRSDYLEDDVENDLTDGVESLGGLCLKIKLLGRIGFPDRLVLLPGGRVIFVELKKPRGKVASWQSRFHTKLRELGFTVEVLWTRERVTDFLMCL